MKPYYLWDTKCRQILFKEHEFNLYSGSVQPIWLN